MDHVHNTEKYAIVRVDRSIPGGLRIVGSPQPDEEWARLAAAGYATPHEVLPLSEVYRRRTAALQAAEDGVA